MSENVRHDEGTLAKVYQGLDGHGLTEQQKIDCVSSMQNEGILFRERGPENPTVPVVIMSPELIEQLGTPSAPVRLVVTQPTPGQYELEAKASPRYRLQSDDDGHWYVVRTDTAQAFDAYVESEGAMAFPDGVTAINGWPGRLTFMAPELDGEVIE